MSGYIPYAGIENFETPDKSFRLENYGLRSMFTHYLSYVRGLGDTLGITEGSVEYVGYGVHCFAAIIIEKNRYQ